MAPARIRKVKDWMELPEGKWFEVRPGPDFDLVRELADSEVPEGLDLDVIYDDYITVYRDDIVVPVPPRVARRFGGRGCVRLEARVEGTNLIIERRPAAKRMRAAKRKRAA